MAVVWAYIISDNGAVAKATALFAIGSEYKQAMVQNFLLHLCKYVNL